MTNTIQERPLKGLELEKAIDDVVIESQKWDLEVIKRVNNTTNKNNNRQVNHLTITGGVREVQYYPSKGTWYANGVRGIYRMVKGSGIRDAIEVAKNGNVKKH